MKRVHLAELVLVLLLAAGMAAAIPLSTGYFGWSWDALNHHVYLGMTAEHPRWDLDVTAGSFQVYQYPYVYWPVYRLSLLTGSGALIAALWTAFQAVMLVLPVWWISLRLLPDRGAAWASAAQRLAACTLAFLNGVVLVGLETTANDVAAAVPLLWAVAVVLRDPASTQRAFWAAALWGMAVAFKLSNGLFLPLLLFWWWQERAPHLPWPRALALAGGACAGFLAFYAPWGWQLWRVSGNPFYPFLSQYFGGA